MPNQRFKTDAAKAAPLNRECVPGMSQRSGVKVPCLGIRGAAHWTFGVFGITQKPTFRGLKVPTDGLRLEDLELLGCQQVE